MLKNTKSTKNIMVQKKVFNKSLWILCPYLCSYHQVLVVGNCQCIQFYQAALYRKKSQNVPA